MLNLTKYETFPNVDNVEDQHLLNELLTINIPDLKSLGEAYLEDKARALVNSFVLPALIRQCEDFCQNEWQAGSNGSSPARGMEALRLVNKAKTLHVLLDAAYPLMREFERYMPRGVVIHTFMGNDPYPFI